MKRITSKFILAITVILTATTAQSAPHQAYWMQMGHPSQAEKIAYCKDTGHLWALNTDKRLYYNTSNGSDAYWKYDQRPFYAMDISCNLALNHDKSVWYRNSEPGSDYSYLSYAPQAIAIGEDRTAVNSDGSIWRYYDSPGYPRTTSVEGYWGNFNGTIKQWGATAVGGTKAAVGTQPYAYNFAFTVKNGELYYRANSYTGYTEQCKFWKIDRYYNAPTDRIIDIAVVSHNIVFALTSSRQLYRVIVLPQPSGYKCT